MEIYIQGKIAVRGNCGHEFHVSIAQLQSDFVCPICGVNDRFTEDQIKAVQEQLRSDAISFGADKVREALQEGICDGTKGSKNITFRT